MKCLIRVKANHGCWIADIDGDPGRTTIREKARIYNSRFLADKQVKQLEKKHPNREFIIEKQ